MSYLLADREKNQKARRKQQNLALILNALSQVGNALHRQKQSEMEMASREKIAEADRMMKELELGQRGQQHADTMEERRADREQRARESSIDAGLRARGQDVQMRVAEVYGPRSSGSRDRAITGAEAEAQSIVEEFGGGDPAKAMAAIEARAKGLDWLEDAEEIDDLARAKRLVRQAAGRQSLRGQSGGSQGFKPGMEALLQPGASATPPVKPSGEPNARALQAMGNQEMGPFAEGSTPQEMAYSRLTGLYLRYLTQRDPVAFEALNHMFGGALGDSLQSQMTNQLPVPTRRVGPFGTSTDPRSR